MITPLERKKNGVDMDNEKFFITIKAQGWSLFDFRVSPETKNQLYLSFDYPEVGEILEGEIINYKLVLVGNKPSNITIQNTIKYGMVSIFVKQCTIKDCEIT